jgi:hypothetical protein
MSQKANNKYEVLVGSPNWAMKYNVKLSKYPIEAGVHGD